MIAASKASFSDILGFADDNPDLEGNLIEGLPVLGTVTQVMREFGPTDYGFHCAIGKNQLRQNLAGVFERAGFEAVALIDPSAVIAETAQVGPGSYVGPLSIVAPHVRVGRHVLINVGASIGHHSRCADFTQVCPGARLSGHTHLAEGAFIGSNGVLAPGVSVGEWATVGAASLAARDVPARATALGVPAKILAVPTS